MVWWSLGCGSSPVDVASTPSAPPPPVPASPARVSLYTGVAWDVVRWEMTAEEAEEALVQRGLPTQIRSRRQDTSWPITSPGAEHPHGQNGLCSSW